MKEFDLTTLGSTMLCLSTEVGVPLMGSDHLRVDIAGSESNLGIALAGLGKRVAWLSKVARTPLGERIVSRIRAGGVDVSRVAWSREGRNELMWVEAGMGENRTNVVYDRAGAAIESIRIEDVDLATVEASEYFHFSGITPALSGSCRDTLLEVIKRARRTGVKVSCDVNYRSKLWTPDQAQAVLSEMIADLDLLFLGEGDLRTLWGRNGEAIEELRALQQEFRIEKVILTRGREGAAAYFGDSVMHEHAFAGEVVSPIGAGDAFAAGVLASLLDGEADECLKRGCAMAALARESRSDYVLSGAERLAHKMLPDSGKQISR
ncbi:MAG: sugar kinase [Akkermansiaceae bacterium]|nr:sugar kinase [Akkermansiaceae bacterium]